MMDQQTATPCGLHCRKCEYYSKQCPGCGPTRGRPFGAQDRMPPACPIYDCCINVMMLAHCGQCPKLPCSIFEDFQAPVKSGEQFQGAFTQDRLKFQADLKTGNAKKAIIKEKKNR